MKRNALNYLSQWLTSSDRKPIIIRGARQVGKTWVVRQLAELHQKKLIELNFEKRPDFKSLFESNEPKQIIQEIESRLGHDILLAESILFLDEIQAASHLLAKLRWFAEDMPELAVVTAGSLLDFVLDDHEFSMPVGRVTYLYMEPLCFEEFLLAKNKTKLVDYLINFQWKNTIPESTHQHLLALFHEYVIIGGMPAAVFSWAEKNSLESVGRIQADLLASYRDDFAKYAGRIALPHLEDVMISVPIMLGQKFVLSKVNPNIQTPVIKTALLLIEKARIAHILYATAANGIPVGAETNKKFFKVNLVDVGLVSSLLGLKLNQIREQVDLNLINKGSISEQVVGQLLRCIDPQYIDPALYYWVREKQNANAEIDFIIQHNTDLVPIEVKSGSTGTMKSLHYFMSEKKLPRAVRINADFPSVTMINTKIQNGSNVQYQLLSLPFYLTQQIHRLLEEKN
ncbi:MAG: AAA family ATPase [Gammaproteobacteria bacterium RIFCSPHIGHO2_12_FULL_41_15]|nr:MAG: AAA family ATPase [Gammaproteobacteria bacterium RIFCSPHIGHO2_12_FULL_41_15]